MLLIECKYRNMWIIKIIWLFPYFFPQHSSALSQEVAAVSYWLCILDYC